MILFPIALLWVGGVLYWVLRHYSVDPERPTEEVRRWARDPNRPRTPIGRDPSSGRSERSRAGERGRSSRKTHQAG